MVHVGGSDLTNPYLPLISAEAAAFVDIRRAIHRNPELGFEEHSTSDLIAEQLARLGYEIHRGIGKTGLVAQLRRGCGSRRLGLRADMDALPIKERTGLSYASVNPGVMHACGHDGHSAILLAAAAYLAKYGRFDGVLNLIFQPAEEGLGGAVSMIKDGLFERFPCDAIFAMHNMPGRPAGNLMFRSGPFMASSDYATITLSGEGAHGAKPHLAKDPIVGAASIIMALQTIVSRNVDPKDVAIVTIGAIRGGTANNVIPESVTMELSIRSLTPQTRKLLEDRVRSIVSAQAGSFGLQVEMDFRPGYSVLVNTPEETEFAREIGAQLLGEGRIERQGELITGSEDFAFMLEQVPGSYLMIGNGAGDSCGACMVHNPRYDFNDEILPIGAAYWAMLVERYLR